MADAPFIGVNYGRVGDNLPEPHVVVKLLKQHHKNVKHVKIFDTDQNVVKAFDGSGIKLTVAVTNDKVVPIADKPEEALKWVKHSIKGHEDTITSIAVGNEWLHEKGNPASKLVPAMRNVHDALKALGLERRIKVSTPHAFDVIKDSYPPSHGKFKNADVMEPLLEFLHDTKSFLMMNIYPFLSFVDNTKDILMDYALFKQKDNVGGYTNLFDAMVDAVISAMNAIDPKYKDMKIVITETGWPNGGSHHRGVITDPHTAQAYNQNVINHVLARKGTPGRKKGTPNDSFPTYIFALFNEDGKMGGFDDVEKFWGQFYPNMEPIYELNI